jgi:hypothetical protein
MALRRLLTRGPWAALLTVLLLLGSVEPHPAGEAHEPLAQPGSLSGGTYYPEAAHPDQPVHFEQGYAVKVPPCPACLLHLQTTGADLSAVARVAPPEPQVPLSLAAFLLSRRPAGRPAGARGPPSLS